MGEGKYFRGIKSNSGWFEKESQTARSERGHGWLTFRRKVIAERGMKCEHCGAELKDLWIKGKTLDVHHKIKIRLARHLRFERSNVLVLCQPCHVKFERFADDKGSDLPGIDLEKAYSQPAAAQNKHPRVAGVKWP